MKKITLTNFTKIFFTTRINQKNYQTKTKEAVHRSLITLCLTATLLLGAVGQIKAASVPASLTFTGGTNKTATNTIDGNSFTTYQYFSGAGSTTSNNASFTVTGPCTIYLYATGGDNATTSRD